jgi:chromate transport protein ChrA
LIYLDLFLGFLRVGCFAFGGAYGAIPLIRDVVLSYGWLTDETLTYMIAVSESTPGPIMVNLATYVGSSQAGALGAALATSAVVLPSFLVILLVTIALKDILKNKYVQAVLRGLKRQTANTQSNIAYNANSNSGRFGDCDVWGVRGEESSGYVNSPLPQMHSPRYLDPIYH